MSTNNGHSLDELKRLINTSIKQNIIIDTDIFKQYKYKDIDLVVRSLSTPFPIFPFSAILKKIEEDIQNEKEELSISSDSRENDLESIKTIINQLFSKENLIDRANIAFFVYFVNSTRLEQQNQINFLRIFNLNTSHIIGSSDEYCFRFLICDGIEDEKIKFLTDTKLASYDKSNRICFFQNIGFSKFRDEVIEHQMSYFELWHDSIDVEECLYTNSMKLVYNELFESEPSNADSSHSSYNSNEIILTFYNRYKERLNNSKDITAINNIQHIAWIIINYFYGRSKEIFNIYESCSELEDILIDYLNINIEENLKIFVYQLSSIEQKYRAKYGRPYDGLEHSGSIGSSCGGGNITIEDTHVCEKILFPALKKISEGCEDNLSFFELLESNFFKTDTKVSSQNPIFLKRAAIPSLVGLFINSDNNNVKILSRLHSLVHFDAGIPSCVSRLFYEIYMNRQNKDLFSLHAKEILELITDHMSNTVYCIPDVCAFHSLVSLVHYGIKSAEDELFKLLDNPKFIQNGNFQYDILSSIKIVLGPKHKCTKKAIIALIKWKQSSSVPGYDDTLQDITDIIIENAKDMDYIATMQSLCILDHKKQIYYLSSVLRKVAETYPIKCLYYINDFLEDKPIVEVFPQDRDFICNILSNTAKKIQDDIKLDDEKIHAIAIRLLKELANDPPSILDDEYHKKILEGTETGIIATVRAHTCWALMQFSVLKSYINESWEILKGLLNDENNYLVHHALFCFVEILKRRKWDEVNTNEIISVFWSFIDKPKLSMPLEKQLIRLLIYMHDINEEESIRLIERFKDNPEISKTILYFALYRPEQFTELPSYDPTEAINILKRELLSSNSSITVGIVRGFREIINSNSSDWIKVKPYIFDMIKYKVVNDEIAPELYTFFAKLLEGIDNGSKEEICELIQAYIELYVEHKKNGSTERHSDIFGYRLFRKIYEFSPSAFYGLQNVLVEFYSCHTNIYLNHDIESILNNEENDQYLSKARGFIEQLAENNENYFPWKERWISKRKEMGLLK